MNTDDPFIFKMLFERVPIVCTSGEWPAVRRAVEYEAIKWQWAGAKEWVDYAVTEINRLDAMYGLPVGAMPYADWPCA